MPIRLGLSWATADRFYSKAMRRRSAQHSELVDRLGQAMSNSIPHSELIFTVTDEAPLAVQLDLDDDIGIIGVGRDTSISYKLKSNPDYSAMDDEFAGICDRAIDAYPYFSVESRHSLHGIVDDWRKSLQTNGSR